MLKSENITSDDFRIIKAIADAGGTQGAAAWLGVNNSTVFRHLYKIEKQVGAAIFERLRSRYIPTSIGEEMVKLADLFDEAISSFARKVAEEQFPPTGKLRVATSDIVLNNVLTPTFAGFQQKSPHLRLEIAVANKMLDFVKGDADVAICVTNSPPEALIGRRVARIAWALYGRAGNVEQSEASARGDFAELTWVSLGDELGSSKPVRYVREQVAPERIAYEVNSILGLAEAIENGIGIGHLPCYLGDVRPELTRLAPPVPDLSEDLWLLTHSELRKSTRVRVFLDYIGAEIGTSRPLFEGEHSRQHVCGEVAGV